MATLWNRLVVWMSIPVAAALASLVGCTSPASPRRDAIGGRDDALLGAGCAQAGGFCDASSRCVRYELGPEGFFELDLGACGGGGLGGGGSSGGGGPGGGVRTEPCPAGELDCFSSEAPNRCFRVEGRCSWASQVCPEAAVRCAADCVRDGEHAEGVGTCCSGVATNGRCGFGGTSASDAGPPREEAGATTGCRDRFQACDQDGNTCCAGFACVDGQCIEPVNGFCDEAHVNQRCYPHSDPLRNHRCCRVSGVLLCALPDQCDG